MLLIDKGGADRHYLDRDCDGYTWPPFNPSGARPPGQVEAEADSFTDRVETTFDDIAAQLAAKEIRSE